MPRRVGLCPAGISEAPLLCHQFAVVLLLAPVDLESGSQMCEEGDGIVILHPALKHTCCHMMVYVLRFRAGQYGLKVLSGYDNTQYICISISTFLEITSLNCPISLLTSENLSGFVTRCEAQPC